MDRIFRLLIISAALMIFSSWTVTFSRTYKNDEIVLQLAWTHQFQFAGYYAAVHKGFYREMGLNVSISEGGNGVFAREQVLNGRAQYGIAGAELVLHRAAGDPFVVLAPIFQHSASIILTKAESDINTPADLIGKKLMILPENKDADILSVFLNEGIDFNRITRVDQTYDINDLITGKTDAVSAYLTNEPFYLLQKEINPGIIQPQTYGVDFYSDCLFTTEEELSKNTDRVKRFLAASVMGWEYAMKNKEEVIQIILQYYNSQKRIDHLRYEADVMEELIVPRLVQIGHMNPGRWEHIAQTFRNLGELSESFSLDGFLYIQDSEQDLENLRKILFFSIFALIFVSGIALLFYHFNQRLKKEMSSKFEALASLKKSESEKEAILNGISAYIAYLDTDLKALWVNKTVREAMGISREDVVGKKCHFLWRNSHEPCHNCPAIIALKTGRSQSVLMNDSQNRVWESRGEPVLSESGQVIGVVEISRDVTSLKNAEDALKQSEEQYRLIFEKSPIGIIYLSQESVIRKCNDYFVNMMGSSHEKLDNFNMLENIPEGEFRNSVSEALKAGHSSFECEYQSVTGKKDLVIRGFFQQILDTDSKVIGYIGMLEDVSEKKKLEERLRRSQKIEAISTLAGGIAHDFNNMLGVIAGNVSHALDLLEENHPVNSILIDVQSGALQASLLTKQLLTFSRGGAPIRKNADINQLIKESAQFINRGANTQCQFLLDRQLWNSKVDAGQLTQVIHNLILNAQQAMPDGGVIKIQTRNIEQDKGNDLSLPEGRYIQVMIEDNGVGIPSENIDKLFDPFFTTKNNGTGLGLSTSYSIIKQHDGIILVESDPGLKTAFSIYLPATTETPKRTESIVDRPMEGRARILVMDDQEAIQRMVERMLTRLGYEIDLAFNGEQAVKLYQTALQNNKRYDLVILDLTIPGGPGGEQTVMDLIEIDPDVVALVSSGYSNDPIMANYQVYGFKDVIPKPYTLSQLSTVLKKNLEK